MASTNIPADEQTIAQYHADARLIDEYDESAGTSGKLFDYSKEVFSASEMKSSDERIVAYMEKIQRGGFVQSFGCVLIVEESSFKIIGFSENCLDLDMLGLRNGLIGIDARTLFTPSSVDSFVRAFRLSEMSLMNPICVLSSTNHRPFYAILHKIDVGVVIDLEPIRSSDPPALHADALQSQTLAVRGISRLQSLPIRGDIGVLCDTIVEDVQKLTGFDRVMVYKFHDDNHGEVISEITRTDLEPYLGVHYPATDIPHAARFLFKLNRVRMIYDCRAQPVRIIQTEELEKPIYLGQSTLRSPHGCHSQYMRNMGSIASLVMAILVNDELWGLVVCHHTSPHYVPFPLRHACEFLMEAFSLQLQMELQKESQLREKKMFHVQALLTDMFLRDAPLGIVTHSPNIMDLVSCDGAALYYGGKCWLLGVTPTHEQLQNIVEWLLTILGDSMGLHTDSLANAGYPALQLGGDAAVCGMTTARIASSSNFLFWFRSQTGNECRWGGAKHHPDDGQMNPRTSFNTFLELVKSRSQPWEAMDINAIHSLQLIMRDSLQMIEESGSSSKAGVLSQTSACDDAQLDEQLTSMAVKMVRLIDTAAAPIFGVDSQGLINGWNTKICELTGLEMAEALGKSLISCVHEDSREVVELLLATALQGKEDKNVEIKLLKFGINAPDSVVHIRANACTSRDYKNDVVGVRFVGQDITAEKIVMNRFIRLERDYNSMIPPIFASDENVRCSEWNTVMENLTGWMRHEIIGKMLPGEIFGSLCQLKGPDVLAKFMIHLYRAICGNDTENLAFGFFNRKGEFVEVNLTASKRVDEKGNVIGCLCFLQTVGINENESIVDKKEETENLSKELTCIMHEMKNPLSGIRFNHQLLLSSVLSDDQKRFLETSDACERQILSIIDDGHFGNLEEDNTELKMEEFVLGNLVDAVVSQVMILLRDKSLHLIHDIPEEIKTLRVYGDQNKLQLALSDFLVSTVDYAPSPDGWVEIKVSPGLKLIRDGNEYVNLEFRMAHPGKGLPSSLIEDMFDVENHWITQEGTALKISQKLLSLMNANVQYIRELNKCYFQINLELKLGKPK